MPTLLQASMSSVPAGAVIFFPSTVSVTSAISVAPASRRLSRGRPAGCRAGVSPSQRTNKFNPAGIRAHSGPAPPLRYHCPLFDRALFFIRARAAFQVIFELLTKFLDETHSRHGGSIAERAERPAQHVFRQVIHVVDIFLQPAAGMETLQR